MQKFLKITVSAGGLLLLQAVGCVVDAGQAQLMAVRHGSHDGQTRLVLDLDSEVKIKNFNLQNPPRLVVDLPNTAHSSALPTKFSENSLVRSVRDGNRPNGGLRLVFETTHIAKATTRYLKPTVGGKHRVVLDLVRGQLPAAQKPSNDQLRVEKAPVAPKIVPTGRVIELAGRSSDVIVVIDAGHGGKDPGASGARNSQEKDITLAIAMRLYRMLKDTPDIKPVLLRSDDRFISLPERVRLTREAKADLMISLHADAFKSSGPSGSSVYVLSLEKASSTAARFLAEKENTLGGLGKTKENNDVVRKIVLDLSQVASRELAHSAASRILKHIGKVNKLHRSTVGHAGFVVLQAVDVPSVLVEMAFISNPKEEHRLSTSSYQEKFAASLRDGVVEYFINNAPYGTNYFEKYRGARIVASSE